MNEFNITLNMHNYFDFDRTYYEKRYGLFYLSLVSKATGEIIEIPMTNEQFDSLLLEMEQGMVHKQNMLNNIPMLRYYFAVGGAYEQANKKETN